jgi:hypothetical protein
MPEPFCGTNDEYSQNSVVYIRCGVGGDTPSDRNNYRYRNLVGFMVQPLFFPSPSRCFAIVFWLFHYSTALSFVHISGICLEPVLLCIRCTRARTCQRSTSIWPASEDFDTQPQGSIVQAHIFWVVKHMPLPILPYLIPITSSQPITP